MSMSVHTSLSNKLLRYSPCACYSGKIEIVVIFVLRRKYICVYIYINLAWMMLSYPLSEDPAARIHSDSSLLSQTSFKSSISFVNRATTKSKTKLSNIKIQTSSITTGFVNIHIPLSQKCTTQHKLKSTQTATSRSGSFMCRNDNETPQNNISIKTVMSRLPHLFLKW